MEISVATVALAFLVVAVTALGAAGLNWIWVRPKQLEKRLREMGFSGNRYRPFVGDTKERIAMETKAKSSPISLSDDIVPRVAPFLLHTVQKYGKDSFTWLGPIPFVNITQPDMIKEIFARHYEITKSNSNPLMKLLADGLANYEGEKWAIHRRIINPAFHMEKLKSMMPAFQECCDQMIRKWEDQQEVEAWQHLQELSCDIISRAAFGSNYGEGKRIFDLLKIQSDLLTQVSRSTYVPGWWFLPTRTNRIVKQLNEEIRASLRCVIGKREKAMTAGEYYNDDLLGILMQSNKSEINHHGKMELRMTINEVMEECKLFYLAGQETTSTMLVWTMVLLGKHQAWQEAAREEVKTVFNGKIPDFDNLWRLKKIPMIFNEVLRLYPPVVNLTRAIHEEVKIGSLVFPAGVHINLPTVLVHRDRALWGGDAADFNPERFAGGISKSAAKQVSFFPFGGGARICIGQQFSLLEAKLALCKILQRFSFELSPSYLHAPHSAITLQPQHRVPIILHKI